MRSLKRAVKWIGLVAVLVVAILLIVHSVRLSRSDRRLEKQLATLRAAGDPVRLPDLAGPSISPEENANTYLQRAGHDVQSLYEELKPLFVAGAIREERPADEDVAKIRSGWDAYPAIYPLLDRAAGCDRFDAGWDFTVDADTFIREDGERSTEFRAYIRVLHARAAWQLADGRCDDALATATLMLRLTRHFDSTSAIFIRYLVGIACRGISLDLAHRIIRDAPVSQSMRETLEAELLTHDVFAVLAASLRTERVIGIEKYAVLPNRNNWFLRRMWNEDQSTYLDMIDRHLGLVGQTYTDFQSARSSDDWGFNGGQAPLAHNVLPATWAAYEATVRTEAQIRCLLLLNKLASQPQELDPATLDPASLGLPQDVLVDPYNGKRLRISRLSGGWQIYSVGRNLMDDGGKLATYRDIGFGPGALSNTPEEDARPD